MITAADARNLALMSDVEIDKLLINISTSIESQAKLGKLSMWLTNTVPYDARYQVDDSAAGSYRAVELSPIQKRLQEKLTTFGYSMRLESETYDANRGRMAEDPDGEPNMKKRYYIKINW